MDKTTTLMFRIACGMVITVCGMVISVPVIKGVMWVRGEFRFNQCMDRYSRQYPGNSERSARIYCSDWRYDPDLF